MFHELIRSLPEDQARQLREEYVKVCTENIHLRTALEELYYAVEAQRAHNSQQTAVKMRATRDVLQRFTTRLHVPEFLKKKEATYCAVEGCILLAGHTGNCMNKKCELFLEGSFMPVADAPHYPADNGEARPA